MARRTQTRTTKSEPLVSNGDGAAAMTARRDIATFEPAAPMARPDTRLLAHDVFDRAEKVRALRTELMMRGGSSGRAELIALMSPCAGEGRSLLAAELAMSFAQTGRKTLLVDADLRHPRQHLLFNADNSVGLAQAIESGSTPQLYAVHGLPTMSLLIAGKVCANPLELLSNDGFASMIEEWRRNFDFVVFDTTPVKKYADGIAVASLVGRVLALSRAQRTPYRDMRDMLRRLSTTRSQILGTVISHF